MIFRPGDGSSSITNVVVVILLLVILFFHFSTNRRRTSHIHIGDNVIHNRTVTDF